MTFSLAQGANSLLFNLVMELRGGNIRRCEALGLKPEEMRLLRSLTMEELHYLSGSPVSVLNVAIHHENLKRMLDQANREQKRSERIDRAIALGASIEMMGIFFGLNASDVSSKRRLEGIQTRQGRCQSPGEECEAKIWRLWHEANISDIESLNSLETMMLIAEEADVSLTVIWGLIKNWCTGEVA
ncbi:TPA: DUF2857 domain-containing protein [Salmonella enterica subsp. enterica serovar Enteritidis]|nr:DUF2857 domain-containing protein [Salmonella enterica]